MTIILSTHILEEADALCDRICVLDRGELKAIGTSTELKTKYGNGFKLAFLIKKGYSEAKTHLNTLIKSLIPQAELVDDSGGAVLFAIKLCDID